MNNSSIGIYPFMVVDRERRRRRRKLAKWTATVLAVLRSLSHFPLRRLEICGPGWTEPCRTPCVFVGNNEYRLERTSFGTRARIDRGELWLCVAPPQSRLGLLSLALKSALGLLRQSRDLRTFRADSAEIRSRRKRLVVAVDGEVEILETPLRTARAGRAARLRSRPEPPPTGPGASAEPASSLMRAPPSCAPPSRGDWRRARCMSSARRFIRAIEACRVRSSSGDGAVEVLGGDTLHGHLRH